MRNTTNYNKERWPDDYRIMISRISGLSAWLIPSYGRSMCGTYGHENPLGTIPEDLAHGKAKISEKSRESPWLVF
jgi:hypothetical protein